MAWKETDKDELTEGQKKAAKWAGIPADRPGLGGEYPKAVYKQDTTGSDRTYLGEPLKVAGQFSVKTDVVNSLEEEEDALAQGWSLSPDLKAAEAKRDAIAERDAEIAALRAQNAALMSDGQKRGPGRPARQAMESAIEDI